MEHPSCRRGRPSPRSTRRALAHNFARARAHRRRRARVLPVVKADAYGHGAALVARAARDAGAERFAVATAAEAASCCAARGCTAPIVVLGGVYPGEHDRRGRGTTSRRSSGTLETRARARRARRAPPAGVVPVHVKVDTGMRRLGVAPRRRRRRCSARSREIDGVTVEGLLTHFATPRRRAAAATSAARRASSARRRARRARSRPRIVHAANSAATLTAAGAHFDARAPGARALRHAARRGRARGARACGR